MLGHLGVRTELDQVVPVDDLAADEAARDVRVDRTGRVERGLTVAQRPGTRVLFTRCEEGDQVEGLRKAAGDLVERRLAAVAKGLGLVVRELRELRLEFQVDPGRAVDDREQRLRGQRLELTRQLAVVVRELAAGIDVGEDLLSSSSSPRIFASPDFACFSTRSSRRST